MKDPYSTLGITKNATDEEVKAAYRELAQLAMVGKQFQHRRGEAAYEAVFRILYIAYKYRVLASI